MNKTKFQDMIQEMATFHRGYTKPDRSMLRSWYTALQGNDYIDSDIIKAVSSIRDDDMITEFPSLNQFRREVETQKRFRIGPVRQSEAISPEKPPKVPSYDKAQAHDCLRALMTGIQYGKEAGVEAMQKLADKYPNNSQGIMTCVGVIREWEK